MRVPHHPLVMLNLFQHPFLRLDRPFVHEKFNTYRFADYTESMIELLSKVVRVGVETVEITEAMKTLDRAGWETDSN